MCGNDHKILVHSSYEVGHDTFIDVDDVINQELQHLTVAYCSQHIFVSDRMSVITTHTVTDDADMNKPDTTDDDQTVLINKHKLSVVLPKVQVCASYETFTFYC